MVLICFGAIATALLLISFLVWAIISLSHENSETCAFGTWGWGFINTVLIVMLTIAWTQYGMNRHWENYLAGHGMGEFVQKKNQNGPYLEFQLVPPVPPTKEPLTLINPEATP